eukprot:1476902-Amphidinium_carterae.1
MERIVPRGRTLRTVKELGHAKMKLHDYFNPATGLWDEAGLTADLEILLKRKAQPAKPGPTEEQTASANQAASTGPE